MCSIKRFLSLLLLCLFCTGVFAQDKFVVVLDPGHGGKDGGAVRGVYNEKDINLGVALILGDLIEQNFKDVKVVFTRKKDVFVDLNKRAQIANNAKANLFISIHTNSTPAKTTNASGADTYILGLAKSAENAEVAKRENSVILLEDDYSTKYEGFDPNSPESYIIFEFMSNKYMEQSLKFAEFVQSDIKNVARRSDRGVRQAGFLVLRKTSMPSVLIELGFINNPAEAKFLSSRLGQRSMATAIYSGFKKFKLDFDKKGRYAYTKKEDEKENVVAKVEAAPSVLSSKKPEEKPESVPVAKVTKEETKAVSKPEPKVEPKPEPKKLEPKADTTDKIVYKVQFLVASTVLVENSSQLKGLSPVGYYKDDGSIKYTYGETTDHDEIIRIQKQIRDKFSDAFVVKFKNGQRIK